MGECLIVRSGGGIDTNNSTATSGVIVSGYTCYVKDELIVGEIPVVDMEFSQLTPSTMIDLKYGYYENNKVTSVSTLEEETVGDTVSSNIMTSFNGWVNGMLVDGNMVNNGTMTQDFPVNGTYYIPQGWHNNGQITQVLSTQDTVTINPSTVNQTLCDADKWTTGDLWVAGDTNLISSNIKNGVELFGLTGTYTGWVDASISLTNFVSFTANRDQHNSVKWWVSGTLPQATYNSLKTSYSKIVSTLWYVSYGVSGEYCNVTVYLMASNGTKSYSYDGYVVNIYGWWEKSKSVTTQLSELTWLKSVEIDVNPSSTNKSFGWVNNYSFTFQR